MKRLVNPAACALVLLTTLGSSGLSWADRAHNGRSDDSEQLRYTHSPNFSADNTPRLIAPQGFRRDGRSIGNDQGNAWQVRSDARDRQRDSARFDERDEPTASSRRSYTPRDDIIQQRLYDDRRGDSNSPRDNSPRDNPRPVNDVIREVQQRYGGQVIGVQNSAGGSQYRVRVLQSDGRVRNVVVPAE